jgi:transcriptional regulator with XRE-family HTH domain
VRIGKRSANWRSEARHSAGLTKILVRLGKRVLALRTEKGLTQEALATRAEIDAKHLQDVEHGRSNATVATLAGIAKGLGVEIGELFAL